MINSVQFRSEIVKPTLDLLGLWSEAAENLVWGTAVHESKLTYLRQLGGGPALGFFQMEPVTHNDIWDSFLVYRPGLQSLVQALVASKPDKITQLETNLFYATAMCRLKYYRDPAPLPNADDLSALGALWKRVYNSPLGAGTAEQWVNDYKAAI